MPAATSRASSHTYEAFARGKAVIASDRASIPEIADAFAPCLDPTDESAWSGEMRRWILDPRHACLRGQDQGRVAAGVVGRGRPAVLPHDARTGWRRRLMGITKGDGRRAETVGFEPSIRLESV
jgi:hypothetical protein